MLLTALGDRFSFYTRLSVRNAIAYGVDVRIRVLIPLERVRVSLSQKRHRWLHDR